MTIYLLEKCNTCSQAAMVIYTGKGKGKSVFDGSLKQVWVESLPTHDHGYLQWINSLQERGKKQHQLMPRLLAATCSFWITDQSLHLEELLVQWIVFDFYHFMTKKKEEKGKVNRSSIETQDKRFSRLKKCQGRSAPTHHFAAVVQLQEQKHVSNNDYSETPELIDNTKHKRSHDSRDHWSMITSQGEHKKGLSYKHSTSH